MRHDKRDLRPTSSSVVPRGLVETTQDAQIAGADPTPLRIKPAAQLSPLPTARRVLQRGSISFISVHEHFAGGDSPH
jgi:hypothetical protein